MYQLRSARLLGGKRKKPDKKTRKAIVEEIITEVASTRKPIQRKKTAKPVITKNRQKRDAFIVDPNVR